MPTSLHPQRQKIPQDPPNWIRSVGSEVRYEDVWGTDWQNGRTREFAEGNSIWKWTGITEKDSPNQEWTEINGMVWERTSKGHSDIVSQDGVGRGRSVIQIGLRY